MILLTSFAAYKLTNGNTDTFKGGNRLPRGVNVPLPPPK